MLVDADAESDHPVVDVADEFAVSGDDFGCVEDGAGTVGQRVVLDVVVAARSPGGKVGLQGVPVGVAAGGVRFADTGVAVADADGALGADCVGELSETAMFLGQDEGLVHSSSSS